MAVEIEAPTLLGWPRFCYLLDSLRQWAATEGSDQMARQEANSAQACPPHHWLITGLDHRGQHWSCLRCAAQRDLALDYVSAYVVAAKLLTKVGATDLAIIAADRAATKAIEADSMIARGMAAYQVVCALSRADLSDQAEHLAVGMAEQVQRDVRADKQSAVSVAGSLWLIASVIAARRMDRDEAWARLDRAEYLAGLLGHDGNYAWTAFGPANVALHRVSVATEMGDAAEAVRAASGVDITNFPEGLKSRRAQLHLDLAWAQAQRRRDAEAILHLIEAEHVAPEAVRYNVIVRELVREMLTRAGRTQTSSLTDLAVRAGVLD